MTLITLVARIQCWRACWWKCVSRCTEYREVFDSFDDNGDGHISIDELRQMMQQMGQEPDEEDLKNMMASADADSE